MPFLMEKYNKTKRYPTLLYYYYLLANTVSSCVQFILIFKIKFLNASMKREALLSKSQIGIQRSKIKFFLMIEAPNAYFR